MTDAKRASKGITVEECVVNEAATEDIVEDSCAMNEAVEDNWAVDEATVEDDRTVDEATVDDDRVMENDRAMDKAAVDKAVVDNGVDNDRTKHDRAVEDDCAMDIVEDGSTSSVRLLLLAEEYHRLDYQNCKWKDTKSVNSVFSSPPCHGWGRSNADRRILDYTIS